MKWYVYEHWRPDKDVCFYVGKGSGKRAASMRQRNRYHQHLQAKLAHLGMCVEVRMVADGLTEAEALEHERQRIAFWKAAGVKLANLSDGGGGMSNPAPEVREKMRKAKLGNKINLGRRHTDAAKAKVGAASKGRRARLGHKATAETKAKMREIGLARIDLFKQYAALGPAASAKRVRCLDDDLVFESASAAARHYGVARSALIELCLGKNYRKSVGGRKFRYEDA